MSLIGNIKQSESYREDIYDDSLGNPTIYFGHLVRKGEVYLHTGKDGEKYLQMDIEIARSEAKDLFPNFESFTQDRQDALTELVFNLGERKLAKRFPTAVHNINLGDWQGGADELKYQNGKTKTTLSLWYQEVHPTRADRILGMLVNG